MSKISKIFSFFIIFSTTAFNLCWGSYTVMQEWSDINLTSIQIIKKYGYPVEVHKAETEDGYILGLHRIPHGKTSNSTSVIPILLVHGLSGSSIQLLLRKSESLPFLLADAGYDVWMLSFRGTPYSKNHRVLSPLFTAFWDFSWHENGVYDIPTSIDYVLAHTQRDQLIYIGYSMGGTAFYAMASMRPEYQKKLRGAILLAPSAYLEHAKTPLRKFAFTSEAFKGPVELVTNSELFEPTSSRIFFTNPNCAKEFFCKNILYLITGSTIELPNNTLVNVIREYVPQSTSLKTIAHLGQLATSGRFQQYDYGFIQNLVEYGTLEPPEYNLEGIKLPLSFILPPNDLINSDVDIERVLKRLPNIKSIYSVPQPLFTHGDLMVAENAKELVYMKVLEQIEHLINPTQ